MHRFLLLLSLVMAPVFAGDIVEDPLERRMLDIAKGLRCAVCQNQPVSESNSDLARDMRAIISEQLSSGKSREEVIEYFVSRYGNYILMKPAFVNGGKLLWLAPFLLLAMLSTAAWWFLRSRRAAVAPPVATISAEDLARVRAAEAEAEVENGTDPQAGDKK